MTVLQSNYLASLAVDVRADMTAYRRSTIEAHRAYLRAGKRLLEARKEAKRGEWGPFIEACGIGERTAQHLLKLAGGGWHPKALTAIGGVRAALEFGRLVSQLTTAADGLPASVVAVRKEPPAIAARKGPESFIAYCERFDEEPSDVIRRLADDLKPRREKPETVAGFSGPGTSGPTARIPDDLEERRAAVRRENEADRERLRGEIARDAEVVKRRLDRERFQPARASAPFVPALPDPGPVPGESAGERLRRVRAERRAAGLCAGCGKPSGDAYRCGACVTKRGTESERAASRRRIGRALEGQIRKAAARGKGVRLTAADVRALMEDERSEFRARLAGVGGGAR